MVQTSGGQKSGSHHSLPHCPVAKHAVATHETSTWERGGTRVEHTTFRPVTMATGKDQARRMVALYCYC